MKFGIFFVSHDFEVIFCYINNNNIEKSSVLCFEILLDGRCAELNFIIKDKLNFSSSS